MIVSPKHLLLSAAAMLGLSGLSMAAPPLEKTGACPPLTRYTPTDVNWGTTFQSHVRPSPTSTYPIGTVQHPLSPDSSINCIQVPAGLKVQGIASELTPGPAPAAAYIMYFTFDEKGRMWAVEPRDYPYVHNSTGTTAAALSSNRTRGGQGRILIYEDTDKDGSLDSYKVFYTGLVLPTSLEYIPGAEGGAIVTVPPYIYFIKKSASNPDTAGDTSRVVSNMGSSNNTYDTHGQPNSLTAGIDNFYYGHTGYNGCGSPVVGSNSGVSCGGGNIWRFKATSIGSDTNIFQIHSNNGPSNAHGIGQMEDGQWFKSGATGTSHNNHQVRHGNGVTSIEVSRTYYPITQDRYMWEGSTTSSDAYGNTSTSSASSGHDFYTARLLPSKYWNRFSFVCEGASKLCNMDSLTLNGSTWRANRMPGPTRSNIFASTDAWTAPLKVRTGPDGALWVLDWYNYLFLHNPASPAQNAAWINVLRAKSRVRIYRIIPESGATDPVLNLSNATVPQLIEALGHSNFTWRMLAQRVLLHRAYTVPERNAIIDSLYSILTTNLQADTINGLGTSPKVLHALWTAAGMKTFTFNANPAKWDSALSGLLLHPAWTVRRNALLAMPVRAASSNAIKTQCAVNDPHPHVRIQALATLITQPAPAGGAAQMVASFRNTDSHSTGAFTAAGSSKVTEIAGTARPNDCPAIKAASGPVIHPVALQGSQGNRGLSARNDLRFDMRDGGFVLSANAQLKSGELTVSDLRGKVVFRSTYNKATGTWSNASAKDLKQPVYFYSFNENGGATLKGRITLSSAF
jgi:putative membrane-bound dehydrogenase-like protein